MFNFHMSYYDITQALSHVTQSGMTELTSYQIECIGRSLSEPFLNKLIDLYPMPKQYRDMVQKAFEAFIAEQESKQESLPSWQEEIHHFVYVNERGKTRKWLEKNYSNPHPDPLAELQSLVLLGLQKIEIMRLLEQTENNRYKERLRKNVKDTKFLEQPQSIDRISDELLMYLQYLKDQKKAGSTFGWSVLSCILNFMETCKNEDEDWNNVLAMIIFSLDAARSDYHAEKIKFIRSKDYTCQKGFEENLLDYFSVFRPQAEKTALSSIEHVIADIISPFVMYIEESEVYGPTPLFFNLYLEAAGYVYTEDCQIWSWKDGVNPSQVETQLSSSYGSNCHQDKQLFHNTLLLLREGELPGTEQNKVIDVLKSHDLIDLVAVKKPQWILSDSPKNDVEIEERLLEIGPFIDRAHLKTVQAIISCDKGYDVLQNMFDLEPPQKKRTTLSKNDIHWHYDFYLESQIAERGDRTLVFYPFLSNYCQLSIQDPFIFPRITCPESQLIYWLDRLSQDAYDLPFLAKLCAQSGYAKALEKLLSLNSYDRRDLLRAPSILYTYALKKGHVDVLITLISLPDFDRHVFYEGKTPLMYASARGIVSMLKVLLQDLIDERDYSYETHMINQGDGTGHTALMHAVIANQSESVRMLLANPLINRYVVFPKTKETLLTYAAQHNFSQIVEELLKIERSSYMLTTPCEIAITKGYLHIAKLFLTHPSLDAERDFLTIAALNHAIVEDQIEIALWIIGFKIDSLRRDYIDYEQSLFRAIEHNRIALIEPFLIHLNKHTTIDRAILTAARENHIEILRLLLSYKKSWHHTYEATDYSNRSALIWALVNKNTEATALLIEKADAINHADIANQTALHYAISYERDIAVVKDLLKCPDIDVNAQTHSGMTPLMYAILEDRLDIVLILLKREELDINLCDHEQDSALILAIKMGRSAMIHAISQHPDIDLYVKNKDKQNALTLTYTTFKERLYERFGTRNKKDGFPEALHEYHAYENSNPGIQAPILFSNSRASKQYYPDPVKRLQSMAACITKRWIRR